MVALAGARCVIFDDVFDEKSQVSDARMKAMVANKKYNSRTLYDANCKQNNVTTQIYCWNTPPNFTFSDPSVANRLCVIDFDSKFVRANDPLSPPLDDSKRVSQQ